MKKLFFLLILIQQNYGCWQNLKDSHMFAGPVYRGNVCSRGYDLWGIEDFPSQKQMECAKEFRRNLQCKDPLYFAHFRTRLATLLASNPNLLTKKQEETLGQSFFECFYEIIVDDYKKKTAYSFLPVYCNDALELIGIMGNPLFSQVLKSHRNNKISDPSRVVTRANTAPASFGVSLSDLKECKNPKSLIHRTLEVIKNGIIKEGDICNFYKETMKGQRVGNVPGLRTLFFEYLCEMAGKCYGNKEKQKELALGFSSFDLIALMKEILGQEHVALQKEKEEKEKVSHTRRGSVS